MTTPQRSEPVPIYTLEGEVIGYASLSFDRDDGEASIEIVETYPDERGRECFFVVAFAPYPDGDKPARVYAFEEGAFSPVGPDELTRHWFPPQGHIPND